MTPLSPKRYTYLIFGLFIALTCMLMSCKISKDITKSLQENDIEVVTVVDSTTTVSDHSKTTTETSRSVTETEDEVIVIEVTGDAEVKPDGTITTGKDARLKKTTTKKKKSSADEVIFKVDSNAINKTKQVTATTDSSDRSTIKQQDKKVDKSTGFPWWLIAMIVTTAALVFIFKKIKPF